MKEKKKVDFKKIRKYFKKVNENFIKEQYFDQFRKVSVKELLEQDLGKIK